jgi:hypothetical protein
LLHLRNRDGHDTDIYEFMSTEIIMMLPLFPVTDSFMRENIWKALRTEICFWSNILYYKAWSTPTVKGIFGTSDQWIFKKSLGNPDNKGN